MELWGDQDFPHRASCCYFHPVPLVRMPVPLPVERHVFSLPLSDSPGHIAHGVALPTRIVDMF